jgi:hypothetical protein
MTVTGISARFSFITAEEFHIANELPRCRHMPDGRATYKTRVVSRTGVTAAKRG